MFFFFWNFIDHKIISTNNMGKKFTFLFVLYFYSFPSYEKKFHIKLPIRSNFCCSHFSNRVQVSDVPINKYWLDDITNMIQPSQKYIKAAGQAHRCILLVRFWSIHDNFFKIICQNHPLCYILEVSFSSMELMYSQLIRCMTKTHWASYYVCSWIHC